MFMSTDSHSVRAIAEMVNAMIHRSSKPVVGPVRQNAQVDVHGAAHFA